MPSSFQGRQIHVLALQLGVAIAHYSSSNSLVYSFGTNSYSAYDVTPHPFKNDSIFVLSSESGQGIYEYNSPRPGLTASTLITKFVAGTPYVDGASGVATMSLAKAFAVNGNATAFFIADTQGHRIRKVILGGEGTDSTTIVGTGTRGTQNADGLGTSMSIGSPWGIAYHTSETSYHIYYTDWAIGSIKRYDPNTERVINIAGGNPTVANEDGLSSQVGLNHIYGLQVSQDGTRIYFVDNSESKIRMHNATSNMITTIAGNGQQGSTDGPASSAKLGLPRYISLCEQTGMLYFSQVSPFCKIRRLDLSTSTVDTIAGDGTPGDADGPGSSARIQDVFGIMHFPSNASHIILAQTDQYLRGIVEFPDSPALVPYPSPALSTSPSPSPTSAPSSSPTSSSPITHSPTSSSPITHSPTSSSPTGMPSATPSQAPQTIAPSSTCPLTTCPSISPTATPSTAGPSSAPLTVETVPVALSAQFDSLVSKVEIRFDVATNAPDDLSCKSMLDMAEEELSTLLGKDYSCVWSTSKMLQIFLGLGFTAEEGTEIILKEEAVALESDLVSSRSSKGTFPTTALFLQLPQVLPSVSVEIKGPAEVGQCSNSSSSPSSPSSASSPVVELVAIAEGFAGKAMQYNWTYLGAKPTPGNAGGMALEEKLQAKAESCSASTLTLDASQTSNFSAGAVYSFQVNVKNWLGNSSYAVHSFEATSSVLPNIVLPGPTQIKVFASRGLYFPAQVVPSCSEETTTSAGSGFITAGRWTQISPPPIQTASLVPDTQSALLRIMPNVMVPEQQYAFRLNASIATSTGVILGRSFVTLNVTSARDDLSAAIVGGTKRLLSLHGSLTNITISVAVSGKSSSDSIQVDWNVTNAYNGQSVMERSSSSSSSQTLIIPTSLLTTSNTYVVAANVSRIGSQFSAVAQQILITTAAAVPNVFIKMHTSESSIYTSYLDTAAASNLNRVNPTGRLVFEGFASNSSTNSFESQPALNARYEFQWSCSSSNLNLSNSQVVKSSSLTNSFLVLASNALKPATTYTFTLSALATATGTYGNASLTVVTNESPALGSCASFPEKGEALSTVFRLSCSGWNDADIPLRYRFQIIETAETKSGSSSSSNSSSYSTSSYPTIITLCEFRQLSFFDTTLVAPIPPSTGLTIRATIADNLDATAISTFSVNVTAPQSLQVSDTKTQLEDLLKAGNVESFKVQFVGLSRYLKSDASLPSTSSSNNVTANAAVRGDLLQLLADDWNQNSPSIRDEAQATLIQDATDFSQSGEISKRAERLAIDLLVNITKSTTSKTIMLTNSSSSSSRDGPHDREERTNTVTAAARAMANLVSAAAASTANDSSSSSSSSTTNAPHQTKSKLSSSDAAKVVEVLSNLSSLLVSGSLPGERTTLLSVERGISSSGDGATTSQSESSISFNLVGQTVEESSSTKLQISAGSAFDSFEVYVPPLPQGGSSSIEIKSEDYLQISSVVVAGSSIYPASNSNSSSSSNMTSSGGLTIIKVKQAKTLVGVIVQNLSSPIRFSVPPGSPPRSNVSNDGVASCRCLYWSPQHERWESDNGLVASLCSSNNGRRQAWCNTSHLTAFSSSTNTEGGDNVDVEVNSVSEDDTTNTKSFDPTTNAVMALNLIFLFVTLVSLPIARCYDRKNRGDDSLEHRNEKQFWRSFNSVRKIHANNERSFPNFLFGTMWMMRRRHPWIAVFCRHPGDYMNSQKRVIVLSTLLFNTATVCLLLIGTEQQIFYLSGMVAASLMSVMLALPVPFALAHLFARQLPPEFRTEFKSSGLIAFLPCLLIIADDVEWDVTNMSKETAAGENTGGGEAGQEDSEQDDDDDEKQSHKMSAAAAALGAQIGSFVGSTVALLRRSSQVDDKSGRGDEDDDYSQKGRQEAWMDGVSARVPRRRSLSLHMKSMSSHAIHSSKCDADRKESVPSHPIHYSNCDADSSKESHRRLSVGSNRSDAQVATTTPKHYDWIATDYVAIWISGTIILGCCFLLAILSYRLGATSTKSALALLICIPEDILVRIFALSLLEFVIVFPFCACCFCGCCAPDQQCEAVMEHATNRIKVSLPCDEPTCSVDENCVVDSVTPKGQECGIRLGWKVLKIDDEPVLELKAFTEILRLVHMTSDVVTIEFLTSNGENHFHSKSSVEGRTATDEKCLRTVLRVEEKAGDKFKNTSEESCTSLNPNLVSNQARNCLKDKNGNFTSRKSIATDTKQNKNLDPNNGDKVGKTSKYISDDAFSSLGPKLRLSLGQSISKDEDSDSDDSILIPTPRLQSRAKVSTRNFLSHLFSQDA